MQLQRNAAQIRQAYPDESTRFLGDTHLGLGFSKKIGFLEITKSRRITRPDLWGFTVFLQLKIGKNYENQIFTEIYRNRTGFIWFFNPEPSLN